MEHEDDHDHSMISESSPSQSQTAPTNSNSFNVTTRYVRKGRGEANEACLTGPILKSILKQKGDQTAGKRSIAMRKSSIKFSRNVCARVESASDDDCILAINSPISSTRIFPVSYPPEDVNKYVIEDTLYKSADVLNDFTENTISREPSYIRSFIASNRFRIQSPYHQKRNGHWSGASAKASSTRCSLVAQKRHKPDLKKLPKHIADLMTDSDGCALSRENDKKYHSRKMALRTITDKVNIPAAKLKTFADTRVPDIVVVAAPIDSKFRLPSPVQEVSENEDEDEIHNLHLSEATTAEHESTDILSGNLGSPTTTPAPVLPKQTADASVGISSRPLRKPHKVYLGVDNGSVFVLGPKTKSPYYAYNTFGVEKEQTHDKGNHASRKWVFNIGNFNDNEISFCLFEKKLTITGFRHPTLQYPDGQTTSITVTVPINFDIKHLYVYRPPGEKSYLLVVEETDRQL